MYTNNIVVYTSNKKLNVITSKHYRKDLILIDTNAVFKEFLYLIKIR